MLNGIGKFGICLMVRPRGKREAHNPFRSRQSQAGTRLQTNNLSLIQSNLP